MEQTLVLIGLYYIGLIGGFALGYRQAKRVSK